MPMMRRGGSVGGGRQLPPDVDGAALSGWCREHLGASVAAPVFTTGHLSAVYGVRLADGRVVVLKVRGGGARLDSMLAASSDTATGTAATSGSSMAGRWRCTTGMRRAGI
jgi:hypothetical protein